MAYSYEHNPTNADAKPLYNDSIFKIWNWFDDRWSCSDWITWHKANVVKYGLQKANEKFLHEWDDLALISNTADCRNLNYAFRDYAKKNGFYDGLGSIITGDIIGGVTDVSHNVAGGISGASKVFKIVLPIVLLVVVVFAIVYLSKGMKSIKK